MQVWIALDSATVARNDGVETAIFIPAADRRHCRCCGGRIGVVKFNPKKADTEKPSCGRRALNQAGNHPIFSGLLS